MFEQFINERQVTGVAAFGVRVWDGGRRGEWAGEAETTVPAEAIARAVAGSWSVVRSATGVEAKARELVGPSMRTARCGATSTG